MITAYKNKRHADCSSRAEMRHDCCACPQAQRTTEHTRRVSFQAATPQNLEMIIIETNEQSTVRAAGEQAGSFYEQTRGVPWSLAAGVRLTVRLSRRMHIIGESLMKCTRASCSAVMRRNGMQGASLSSRSRPQHGLLMAWLDLGRVSRHDPRSTTAHSEDTPLTRRRSGGRASPLSAETATGKASLVLGHVHVCEPVPSSRGAQGLNETASTLLAGEAQGSQRLRSTIAA